MSNWEYNFFNTVECSQTKQERIDMANQEHLDLLKQGSDAWNAWREQHGLVEPDLRYADLTRATLTRADLRYADLTGAYLRYADLTRADLTGAYLGEADLTRAILVETELTRATLRDADLVQANLTGAYLVQTDLRYADLTGANLGEANLTGANLDGANLTGANLGEADLTRAILVETELTRANLTQCSIYGISAWNVQLEGATQDNLVITPYNEPTITVDNLEVAQFIYLLLNNPKIRDVIDTIARKAVLILGRFTPERKTVLDTLREALRTHGYLPILFDFEKPASRDITETISTLAHLARFVIADITDAKSIPQELSMIVPNLPSVPVQPLILASQHEYGMFEHFIRFPWVLPVYSYTDEINLLQSLQEKVITPAEKKAKELEKP
jgi:uncharacterized protein YjbI with pentapeptide repeats